MTEHIFELLRKRKERSERQKEVFKKKKAEEFKAKQASAKRIISGETQYSAVPMELTVLRDLYFKMISTYTGQVKYYTDEMTDGQVALWIRVEKARREVGCSAERYLKAQFVYFDKTFGTYPKTQHLATEGAIERAREFAGPTEGLVLGNMRPPDIDTAARFRQSEKTLQKMMKAQRCSREEFYRRFVLTGVYTFPKEFLEADPAYIRAVGDTCQKKSNSQ